MTPPAWDGPVIPQCPESCCWRLTCSTPIQEGIAMLWRAGRFTKPQDCTFYERRSRLHFETTGQQPPATAAELLAQLGQPRVALSEATIECAAIQAEGNP